MSDPFDLERFVAAQNPVIDAVLMELGAGRKQSHWMWFVFPQIQGLGHSAMARRYAISSGQEARAYLEHPTLGPRLEQCTRAVLAVQGRSAEAIFGSPDWLKFQSSMTLFAKTASSPIVFDDALRRYFGASHDAATVEKLQRSAPGKQTELGG